jgi:hypothetical protein
MNIRKKGKWKTGEDKFVIEEKGKYLKTVPPVQELFNLIRLEIPSCQTKETKQEEEPKDSQKFSQDLLNEIQERPEIKTELDKFRKVQDKIVDELLKGGDK